MIYLIEGNGKVKIGYSKNPQKRLKSLQTGSGDTLYLRKQWNVPKLYEKRLHSILKPVRCRFNREWFKCSNIDDFIALCEEVLFSVEL